MCGQQVVQRRGTAQDRIGWSRGDEDGREEKEGPDYEGKIKRRTLRLGTVVCFQWLGSCSRIVRRPPSMCMKAGKGGF